MSSYQFSTAFHVYIVPDTFTRKPMGYGPVEEVRLSRSDAERLIRKFRSENRWDAMRKLRRFVSAYDPSARPLRNLRDRQVRKRAIRLLTGRTVWRHSQTPGFVQAWRKKQREAADAEAASQEDAAQSRPGGPAPPAEPTPSVSITEPRWVHVSTSARDARPERTEIGDAVHLRATTSGLATGEAMTFELFNESEDPSAPVERVSGTVVEANGDRGVAEAEWTVADLRRGGGGQEITFRATHQDEATQRAALPAGFAFGRAVSRGGTPRAKWPFAVYDTDAEGPQHPDPVHEGTTTAEGQIVAPFPYDERYVVRPQAASSQQARGSRS